MKKRFSTSCLLLFSFLLLSNAAVAQEPDARITASWAKLKGQLLRKTNLSGSLCAALNNTVAAGQTIANNIRSASLAMQLYIDSAVTIDNQKMQKICVLNDELNKAIGTFIAYRMTDTAFQLSAEARNIQTNLESTENRILFAKKNYNTTCIELQRPDLVFCEAAAAIHLKE